MNTKDTAREIMGLSSGTIASLTGFSLYTKIDMVQLSFFLYCQDMKAQGSWQPHWVAFWSGR